jgi:hypothetical protein
MTGPSVQKPIADARPSWGEKVADQRRGGDEDHALDEADTRHDEHELQLGVQERDAVDKHGREQQPVDDQVGPAPSVGRASEDGGERADDSAHNGHSDQVGQRHVEVLADEGGDGAADVERVVELDRDDDDDAQVDGAGTVGRVPVELAAPDAAAGLDRWGRGFDRGSGHGLPFFGDGLAGRRSDAGRRRSNQRRPGRLPGQGRVVRSAVGALGSGWHRRDVMCNTHYPVS